VGRRVPCNLSEQPCWRGGQRSGDRAAWKGRPVHTLPFKRACRVVDALCVDTAARDEILSRYADHSRRFDAVASHRQSDATVIPFQRPDADLELTRREVNVLMLISKGFTNREIGEYLSVSEETVKTHVAHLLPKLRTRSRAHAVANGLRRGIIG